MAIFFAFVVGFAAAACICLLYRMYLLNHFCFLQDNAVLEDLELATKEQLLKELRSRTNASYVLVMPIDIADETGMKIEINSFTPYEAVSLLHLSASLIFKDMKSRGMNVPELPGMDDLEEKS